MGVRGDVLTSPSTLIHATGLKTGYQSNNGPTSQIPGLSTEADCLPEEKARGRRVGVMESDSDYVKLAKQGGQKGRIPPISDRSETLQLISYMFIIFSQMCPHCLVCFIY